MTDTEDVTQISNLTNVGKSFGEVVDGFGEKDVFEEVRDSNILTQTAINKANEIR